MGLNSLQINTMSFLKIKKKKPRFLKNNKKPTDALWLVSDTHILKCVSSILQIKKHLLHCVTITSLRLATKVNEEEEVCIPGS